MSKQFDRRQVLRVVGATCAGFILPGTGFASEGGLERAEEDLEIRISSVSAHTLRLSIFSARSGGAVVASDGSLVRESWDGPVTKLSGEFMEHAVKAGDLSVKVSASPLTFSIAGADGTAIQQLKVERASGVVTFATGNSPLLGLGEGGPQFDRRGSVDTMKRGQGGYKLRNEWRARADSVADRHGAGGRCSFTSRSGRSTLRAAESKFLPAGPDAAFPLDIFFVAAREPATIMAEYARLTGHAELPPLWSFGYQQSHRTLASREEILAEAKTFREKKLPCDTMIYLGTGFCPFGWNTKNGEFAWNARVFPDPQGDVRGIAQGPFHGGAARGDFDGQAARHGAGSVRRRRNSTRRKRAAIGTRTAKILRCGVDGWWPDEGDPLDTPSRLVRNRMYWEGPQIDRPNERPFALHRNGYAGMQRYGVVPVVGRRVFDVGDAENSRSDRGEYGAERAFRIGARTSADSCRRRNSRRELYRALVSVRRVLYAVPLARAHVEAAAAVGLEHRRYGAGRDTQLWRRAMPDASQLHNRAGGTDLPEVSGAALPHAAVSVQRGARVHADGDAGDARVVAALSRRCDGGGARRSSICGAAISWLRRWWSRARLRAQVYLPRGAWYDFWTGERVKGGREITRAVDLETMPLYVRAGAILPMGPVKQYTEEKVDGPLTITIYPGADGSFLLYEDDGNSFNYRKGEWMGMQMQWNDERRVLKLELAGGSRMLAPMRREIEVKVGSTLKKVVFEGKAVEVGF